MAKKAPNGTSGKPARRGKTAAAEDVGGHNHKIDKKKAKAHFDAMDQLTNEFESAAGTFRADKKELLQTAANDLGVSRKTVREVYGEHRYELKRQQREAEMEPSERDSADRLRLALASYANTPLGKAAIEKAELQDAAAAL